MITQLKEACHIYRLGGMLEILSKEGTYIQNQMAKILGVNQRPGRILNDETPLEVFSKEKKLAKSA